MLARALPSAGLRLGDSFECVPLLLFSMASVLTVPDWLILNLAAAYLPGAYQMQLNVNEY